MSGAPPPSAKGKSLEIKLRSACAPSEPPIFRRACQTPPTTAATIACHAAARGRQPPPQVLRSARGHPMPSPRHPTPRALSRPPSNNRSPATEGRSIAVPKGYALEVVPSTPGEG